MGKKRRLEAKAAKQQAEWAAAGGGAEGAPPPPLVLPAVAAEANPEELELPEEVDAAEPACTAPDGAPACDVQPRHLLVLDINGLLIERCIEVRRDAADAPVEPDERVGAFCVYDRPGLREFVRMLLRRFVVGVWSSARQHNLRGLVRHIFGPHEERLAFVYGQEACTFAGTCARNKPLFLKELSRVWADPAFAAFGPRNTLLLDDDAYKAARNPPHTAIHPAKFTWQHGGAADTTLLEHGALWDYLLCLSTQHTVCDWVQACPFVDPTRPAALQADAAADADAADAAEAAAPDAAAAVCGPTPDGA